MVHFPTSHVWWHQRVRSWKMLWRQKLRPCDPRIDRWCRVLAIYHYLFRFIDISFMYHMCMQKLWWFILYIFWFLPIPHTSRHYHTYLHNSIYIPIPFLWTQWRAQGSSAWWRFGNNKFCFWWMVELMPASC